MTETTETSIALPWPAAALSPNARPHWAAKARAVKEARMLAGWMVRTAVQQRAKDWPHVNVAMTFCPPDNRRRDLDNIIASHKAATDGIADALGIDDSLFHCTYAIGAPVKGGAVHVVLSPDYRDVAA
jgi:crossover junction endodeoxyribonuclease RusA